MGEANILLRTRGDRESGWDCIVRCVELEAHLGRVWPTARVTVFAEGDHRTLDWLYARVRDLIGVRLGTNVHDEMGARSMRGRADVVIFDMPTAPDEVLRGAWLADADRLFVRSPDDSIADVEAYLHGVEPTQIEGRGGFCVEQRVDDVLVPQVADLDLS